MLTFALFDIDGTILDTRGAGRRAFIRALDAVFGWHDPLDYLTFSGATDRGVLRQVLQRHGVEDPDGALAARFFKHLPRELEKAAAGSEYVLHAGIPALMAALAARPDVRLGLVTGNIEACARIKLGCFGLAEAFAFGGYGCDDESRRVIARHAVERGRALLRPGEVHARSLLIGDTPSDIDAAHAIDAVAVGVATGKHGQDELRAAGADLVLSDLRDTASIIALIEREVR
jgi:phosphoglycolate phosphatase-like HAD superfamily hydrolase